jgi:iron complex transport system substrate-binding protein
LKRFLVLATVFALVPLLLVACSDDDDDGGTSTSSTKTTSSAITSNASTASSAETAATTSSATTAATSAVTTKTVTDDLDREVEVPAVAERVVALSPTVVELMYAVGAEPVGRPESAEYPPEAASVPSFGSSYTPNFEEIVAMQPDLIIADAIIHAGVIAQLESLGAPVYAVQVDSFQSVVDGLRKVGDLTGNEDGAEKEAAALEKKLADVEAKLPANGPSVLVVVAAGENQFIAARGNSYLGSLIEELGGTNIVQSEPENFRFPGFADYSLEKIVQADPDIIIGISVGGPPGTPKTTEILGFTPVWSGLTAVKEGRVYEVDPVIYLESAGPRVSMILDELPGILYPDVFN